MIYYDPHKWSDHFFDVRGSLVKEIALRVAVCIAWSAAIVWAYRRGFTGLAIPATPHSFVGVALGLLLVFRTNASYDRFWEGRKLWGGIVNESRNLIRGASVHFSQHPRLLQQLARWTALYPRVCANVLRGQADLGTVGVELSAEEVRGVREAQHPPTHVAQQMTALLVEARDRGLISDIILFGLDQNIQLLIDYIGACERIRKTPLPFAYVVHLRRTLIMYCFTLPLALVETFGWNTLLVIFFIAYMFFGIEEIGVEIEGPFGTDENDLPMDEICATIQKNVYALVDLAHPPADALPEG